MIDLMDNDDWDLYDDFYDVQPHPSPEPWYFDPDEAIHHLLLVNLWGGSTESKKKAFWHVADIWWKKTRFHENGWGNRQLTLEEIFYEALKEAHRCCGQDKLYGFKTSQEDIQQFIDDNGLEAAFCAFCEKREKASQQEAREAKAWNMDVDRCLVASLMGHEPMNNLFLGQPWDDNPENTLPTLSDVHLSPPNETLTTPFMHGLFALKRIPQMMPCDASDALDHDATLQEMLIFMEYVYLVLYNTIMPTTHRNQYVAGFSDAIAWGDAYPDHVDDFSQMLNASVGLYGASNMLISIEPAKMRPGYADETLLHDPNRKVIDGVKAALDVLNRAFFQSLREKPNAHNHNQASFIAFSQAHGGKGAAICAIISHMQCHGVLPHDLVETEFKQDNVVLGDAPSDNTAPPRQESCRIL